MKGSQDGSREAGARSRILLLIAAVASAVVVAAAQHDQHGGPAKAERVPAAGSKLPAQLGWEPIRCWRQSSAGAITIGETFTVVLTCAVYEADNAQVIPDEARLGVASIQMAPFEILAGAHPADVRRGSRRFFQYDYQLRIISPDAIGRDVNIPPLAISYRIQSRVGAAATLEGRDLSYVMPMMPIKVLSLVPADASDIRDASDASLGAVDSLRFRSSLFQVLTLTFGALSAAMVALALVPLARKRSVDAAGQRNRVPDRAILARVADDLAGVQSRVNGEGWSDDAVARALASTRLVAAAAIGHTISQRDTPPGGAAPEGRLLVEHGLLRRIGASVSTSVTADDVGRARAQAGAGFSTTRQQQLEDLQAGLSAMTAALYRQAPERDAPALDESMRHAIAIAKDMTAERGGWKRWARR